MAEIRLHRLKSTTRWLAPARRVCRSLQRVLGPHFACASQRGTTVERGNRLVDLEGANDGHGVGTRLAAETTSQQPSSVRHAVSAVAKQTVYQLLIANLLLQVFDAVATYNGIALGFREGNPLLRAAFGFWGVGPTLLVLKSFGCTALALIPMAVRLGAGARSTGHRCRCLL